MARSKKKTAKKPATAAGQAAAKEPARKSGGNLVSLTKDGQTIKVNPKCVKDHERLGWGRG